MNNTRAIFLINDNVRAWLCSYEDEGEKPIDKQTLTMFKTFDQTLKEKDYVVVPTDTRHKMTVVRLEKLVDSLDVDIKDPKNLDWIIGRVEKADYNYIKAQEEKALQVIKSAQKRKEREELRKAIEADCGVDLKLLSVATPSSDEAA